MIRVSSNSGLKLSSLLDGDQSSVEALHDDNNNNKHLFLSAADQKSFLECKPLYSHPISNQHEEAIQILLPSEMPDAAKSLGNSGESFLPTQARSRPVALSGCGSGGDTCCCLMLLCGNCWSQLQPVPHLCLCAIA